MTLLANKNVNNLTETFDLELPDLYLEAVEYYELDDHIVISKINVLDANRKFVRLAQNKKVINHLSKYPINFKDNGADNK